MILMACRMTPIRLTGATSTVKRVFDLLQAIKQGLYTSSGYTGPVPGHSDAAWPQGTGLVTVTGHGRVRSRTSLRMSTGSVTTAQATSLRRWWWRRA